ncbi:MAG: ABC transporter substrate-binding protein [Ruminococcaceae bacterium]|nr:ABC transporter substrate-binding protein [Oscillospiraceae bacterium]
MKRYFAFALMLVLLLAGCGQAAPQPTEAPAAPAATEAPAPTEAPVEEAEIPVIRVGAMTGPTGMGLVQLMENENYAFTITGAADELLPKLLQGELDAAALPVNAGATLYQKSGGKVEMACVNTLGVLYIVEKGEEQVKTMADLKGRSLYATGKGSTPEYTLRYLLSQAGLDPDKDVDIQWQSEPAGVVSLMAAEEQAVAMLPQPFVTAALGKLGESAHVAVSLSDEWAALDNGSLMITAGLLVRREFAEQNPEAMAQLLADYKAGTEWVNANYAEAAALCEKHGIAAAAVAEKALPKCGVTFIAGEEMKTALSGFLAILHEQNPASIGGELPGDDFYYGA